MNMILWGVYTSIVAAVLGYAIYITVCFRRSVKRIDYMLTASLNGTFSETVYDETQLSKLENKMFRFLRQGETAKQKITNEKEQIKSLISDISHQTKTPIANIRLYTELLKEQSALAPSVMDMLAQIQFQSEKLDFLVQSLVKTSRLETGIITLRPERQKIKPMLDELYAVYAPLAAKKNIAVNYPENDCGEAVFDYRWTMEAIGNLMDNAIKYTLPGGRIDISAGIYEFFVCVIVKDSGRGIAEDELPRIFERFYRSPQNTGIQGVGIGLYLSREIITKQDGYMKVHSTPGEGSSFSVFLAK